MDFFFLEAHALIRDHPCLRGEYVTGWLVLKYPTGSLPLARGIQVSGYQIGSESRITPACAGNTATRVKSSRKAGDHPRLRGEYWWRPARCRRKRGSPPLARGIQGIMSTDRKLRRITPACAGNMDIQAELEAIREGSPPLARGIPVYLLSDSYKSRITPAYAGNTAHPRI